MAWKKTTSVFKDYEDSDIEPIFTKAGFPILKFGIST